MNKKEMLSPIDKSRYYYGHTNMEMNNSTTNNKNGYSSMHYQMRNPCFISG